jgi:hypothetical protein
MPQLIGAYRLRQPVLERQNFAHCFRTCNVRSSVSSKWVCKYAVTVWLEAFASFFLRYNIRQRCDHLSPQKLLLSAPFPNLALLTHLQTQWDSEPLFPEKKNDQTVKFTTFSQPVPCLTLCKDLRLVTYASYVLVFF